MRDADASEHNVIAVAEGVHIEAVAGADVGDGCRADGFDANEIVIGSEFHVGALAGENGDAMPGPFGERGIVSEIFAPGSGGAEMRLEYKIKGESLWCLHQAQPASIKRLDYGLLLINSLDGVGDSNCGHCRTVFCRCVYRTGNQSASQERSCRIVDEHKVRSDGAERLKSGADGGLPRSPAPDRRQILETGGRCAERSCVLCMNDRLNEADQRMAKKGR